MPAPKHSWLKSGLHFCGSCSITVACWGLWIVLSALFFVLLYVAIARDLPVPEFALRRAEARLAESGLVLRFGRATLDPSGQILLHDVQLRSRQFDDPLLECHLLYVRHSPWSILSGRMEPEEISLEGASLRLPAILSPSGTAESLVSDLAVMVHHGDHVWHIDQFAGRMGSLRLTLQGDVPITGRSPGAAPLSLDDLTAGYLRVARQIAPSIFRLKDLEDPAVAIRLNTDSRSGLIADVVLTIAGTQHPWGQPLQLGALVASTRVRLDGAGLRPAEVYFATRSAIWNDTITSSHVRGVIRTEFQPDKASGRALELQASAGLLTVLGEKIASPVLRTDLAAWPSLRAGAAALIDGEFLTAEVESRLQEQSAFIRAGGRVNPELISRVLRERTPRAAPYFQFADPVTFAGEAVLGPGWHFERLSAGVDFQRLNSHDVKVTAGRGRIDIVGTQFLAHDARVIMGDNEARGSYWSDFATSDYRMLLEGRLRPVDISGWFQSDWWPNFWNRYFSFPVSLPSAEVDLQGRWRDPSVSNSFVRARVNNAKVWGGDFEQVEATLFLRPNFTHGYDLSGARAGGTERVSGSFKRFVVPGSHDPGRFEFDFTAQADPAVLAKMLDGRADDLLATLVFTGPPEVHAWGTIDQGRPDYQFVGNAGKPLHYYGFPLEAVQAAGRVQGTNVDLDRLQFSAAGGQGAGKASLSGPTGARQLGFDLFLNKANLAKTVHAVQEYDANRTGTKPPATASKFLQQAANSSLDIALSAHGDPASLSSFKGAGNAALTGAELGEIQLFGLLSQVLSGLSVSFSSLKLDAARTSFTLLNGEVLFPDLKVTGSSALIDGRGKYVMATNALDFSARFRPFEEPGSLLAAAFSLVLNPLTSILELKLTGKLADPKWSVMVSAGTDPSKPTPPGEPVPAGK